MLKLDGITWTSKETKLKERASKFFLNLFTKEAYPLPRYLFKGLFPPISNRERDLLSRAVTTEEVKEAVFEMSPSKVAGNNGLNAFFFQSQWDTVRPQVTKFVQQAFTSGKFLESLNSTLLVRIPKFDNPESLSQFRPISLCNVLFKILAKVLANQMKLVLPKIISQGQTSFIPGRHITDNIIVAQEMAHSMRKQNGKDIAAIKIDLQKAFDTDGN